ncbi:MAG TPA: hypothetical protein VH853_25420 [Polyangia bacterium]|jgi:hypothetical protein|nr:hypothetical protein [Polyangia bacterium]
MLAVAALVGACQGKITGTTETSGVGGAGGGAAGGSTGAGGAGGATGEGGVSTGGSGGTSATGAGGTTGGSGGSAGRGGAAGSSAGGATGSGGSGAAGSTGSCIGSSMLAKLGKNRLLVGVSTSDATAALAPFDIRYIYLSGGLFDSPTPCTACGSSCTASGKVCTSSCAWWGCYDSPPGMYAGYFFQAAAKPSPPQIPMFTYYQILQTAEAAFTNFAEGTAEATQAAASTSLMTRYYADWRFLLQTIGQQKALLHVEPDFWGYARQAGAPTSVAAAVASANPTDCGSLPNTIAGMGQCLISMVRKYAPNALVGLHASAWNIASNTNKSVDVTTDAKSLATFLAACGQSGADFIVVETSDRDAGYYQTVNNTDSWWDATDATLPDYAQDLTWVKALTEALGTPALYWQTPVGNSSQNNTADHYQDNRVDYFFGGSAAGVESGTATTVAAHWSALAAAHVIGVAFGAGEGTQTTPDTDGGYLVAKTKAYVSAGGQALCP